MFFLLPRYPFAPLRVTGVSPFRFPSSSVPRATPISRLLTHSRQPETLMVMEPRDTGFSLSIVYSSPFWFFPSLLPNRGDQGCSPELFSCSSPCLFFPPAIPGRGLGTGSSWHRAAQLGPAKYCVPASPPFTRHTRGVSAIRLSGCVVGRCAVFFFFVPMPFSIDTLSVGVVFSTERIVDIAFSPSWRRGALSLFVAPAFVFLLLQYDTFSPRLQSAFT